ncbi:MAG: efflux RND transporter permease subunit [Candidatus Omnitrophica bacterium]|nr:efflux RND transporter permease subunit [Candidatus Omnitrophota bacterium]
MNIYGRVAEYFIRNKRLSFLILLGIILWGSISFVVMPKQYNPDIVAPAFSITVEFSGATVDEVYQIVTKPLENVLNEIPGVEHIYSQSIHGGRALVIVEFFVGEDLERSMITLRQKISSRLNLKPLGVSEPFIASIDPEDLPIKTLVLHSTIIDPIALRKRAFYLRDELKHIKGTAYIDVIGGRRREFQIVLDPRMMKETRTALSEIGQALDTTSLLRDLGVIKTDTVYYTVETQEQAVTVNDIENIIISANAEQVLRISDVARVIEGEAEYENYVGFYKKGIAADSAVYITIAKKKGENVISVSHAIDEHLKQLQKELPYLHDIQIEIVKDEGRVARKEIYGLVINLMQAICIVFFVLLLFLNYRAAFIVALSIPIVLLSVVGIGNLFNYTINRITLFALILSLGLLVDNATVVIENIVKNKKKDSNAEKEGIIAQSVSEVGVALLLSTLTTVLAFIPMLFVTGMMGPYMGPLPFFISSTLVISLLCAYSINPWLASILCKDKQVFVDKKHCGFICTLSAKVLSGYRSLLTSLFDSRKKRVLFLISCFALLCIVMTFPVIRLIRFRLLPKADREQIYVYIDLDRGTSLERSQRVARGLVHLLQEERELQSIQTFVGAPPVLDFNGLFKGVSNRKGTHQITLKLNLTHPDRRQEASEDLAYYYRTVLEQQVKEYPDARISIVEDPPGPPVLATFHLKVKSDDTELLHTVAYDLEKRVNKIRELKDVDISIGEEHTKYVLSVDKKAAANARINVETISQELETIFSGRVIGTYHSDYNYEQEYIVLKFSRDLRDAIGDLDSIFIANELGNHVPVSRFVKVKSIEEDDTIIGDDREQTVYISGEMGKRSVTYAVIDVLKMLYDYHVPTLQSHRTHFSLLKASYQTDNHKKITVELGGEWELTVKVFRDLGLAMMVAIILIYLVLVAQFRSFIIPLLILGTIPLAMIGIMPGFALLFFLGRVYFSATSMIGVIALSGIVVNNAIIFIEYTIQTAKKYDSLKETLLDAGLTRFRPILLTSITTVLGSLVIATDPVWSGLSWAIVFGLSLSTLLTLVVFPVLIYDFLGKRWFEEMKL